MPRTPDKTAEAPRAADAHDADFSSPACAMAEAGAIYMGYAGRDELLAALNELLSVSEAGSADRATLLGHIRALGGAPRTGASRGEPGQIVPTLRALLPRVRDAALHADLARILRTSEEQLEPGNNAPNHAQNRRRRKHRRENGN